MSAALQHERGGPMIDDDYDTRLDELDRLLNDPNSKMEPARVWALLAEIAQQQDSAASETVSER